MIYVWLFVILAALFIEFLFSTSLVSIWFAFGGVVSLLLSFFDVSIMIQIFVFIIASIVSIVIFRPIVANYYRGNTVATNADRLINTKCTLIKDIDHDQKGIVKIGDIEWNCVSIDNETIKKDSEVIIVSIDGNKLIVKKL